MDGSLRLSSVLAVVLSTWQPAAIAAELAGDAPGAPGAPGSWAPAQKSFLGTAVAEPSRVYFTGYRGTVSEVFYPTLDAAQTVGLQFLIVDRAKTFMDEERNQAYVATRPDAHSMRWRVVTSNAEHHWRITKEILTDSRRNTVALASTFDATDGRTLRDFDLFVSFDPAVDKSNAGDLSRTRHRRGRTLVVASQGPRAVALAASRPWVRRAGRAMVSSGFVGVSDGHTDLASDRVMNWSYAVAGRGNVAQLGWISLGDETKSSVTFTVALGFGATETDAMANATATLAADIGTLRRRYDAGWHAYTANLDTQGGAADEQYYLAAMTLKCIQDKSNGAMVAGLGTPWGESSGDANPAGYHMVWSRDLFKFANALLTAGDIATGVRVVHYLFDVLQQKADCGSVEGNAPECPQGYTRKGRFPQNAWVDGRQYWTATQMDEQAMPLLLAWRIWDKGDAAVKKEILALWPSMRVTADFVVTHGPWTQQERWEESSGYSPSTIAAEIAGLVAAAELARQSGDAEHAARYLAAADYWQQNVTPWTFTTSGSLGNHAYYIRLNPAPRRARGIGLDMDAPSSGPDDPTILLIGNGGGAHDQRSIVDGGFLELVRLGVKRPTDSSILESLPEYDSTLKQTLPGKGESWFRYNYDGYGERNDGGSYDAVRGRGRLWPIFTAERGMYEIARTGKGESGKPYLDALKAFSTPEGFIPEQVWTETVTRTDWTIVTPPPYVPGTPTNSIAPLHWAMGEYITLVASMAAATAIDIPRVVCARYHACALRPTKNEVSVEINVTAAAAPEEHVYVTGDLDALGGWNTDLGIPADRATYPVWKAAVPLPAGKRVQYRYYRKSSDGSVAWEETAGDGYRECTLPASGVVTWNDTAGWSRDADIRNRRP